MLCHLIGMVGLELQRAALRHIHALVRLDGQRSDTHRRGGGRCRRRRRRRVGALTADRYAQQHKECRQ